MTTHVVTKSTAFPGGFSGSLLRRELETAGLPVLSVGSDSEADTVTMLFSAALDAGQVSAMNAVVAAYPPPAEQPIVYLTEDRSTTSESWGTLLSTTLHAVGDRTVLVFYSVSSSKKKECSLRVQVDGVTVNGVRFKSAGEKVPSQGTIAGDAQSLSQGAHTFVLQWKSDDDENAIRCRPSTNEEFAVLMVEKQ